MNTKNIILGLITFSLLVFPTTTVFAEVGHCPNAEVILAGSSIYGNVVELKNTNPIQCGNWPLHQHRYFFLDDSTNKANAMLATALTAKASGAKVRVSTKIRDNYANGSSVVSLYLH